MLCRKFVAFVANRPICSTFCSLIRDPLPRPEIEKVQNWLDSSPSVQVLRKTTYSQLCHKRFANSTRVKLYKTLALVS